MKFSLASVLWLLVLASSVKAATPSETVPAPTPAPGLTTESMGENESAELQKSKWAEVYNIIDDIKVQNPPRHIILSGGVGFTQVISNSPGDPVSLGLNNNLPSISLSAVGNFFGNVGLETKFVYAQNLIPNSGSPNGISGNIYWLDFGPRYTFFLDAARLEDNLSLKLLFHMNNSNFSLTDNSLCWVDNYMGITTAVERSIPITRKLGLIASLDLVQIFQATTASGATGPSSISVVQQGYGFEIKGELYYIMNLFGQTTRMGVSYWQQGNNNELSASSKESFGKNSYFQLARSVFLSGSFLF